MILFICNYPFPDNSGFSNRCRNVLSSLIEIDKVVILCQRIINNPVSSYQTGGQTIPVVTYGINHESIERTTKSNYFAGLYEMRRAFDLFMNFWTAFNKAISLYKSDKRTKLYVVNSPLTVPLFVYLFSFVRALNLEYLEFHDLEPEMAQEIKNLNRNSFILKIEYFLEKKMCRAFKKIIVTSNSQKERLVKRTGVKSEKVFVKENIVRPVQSTIDDREVIKKYHIRKKDFVVTYVSSLSYSYTTDGVLELFKQIPAIVKKVPEFKFVIVGDGKGLSVLQNVQMKRELKDCVIFTGRTSNVSLILDSSDACIIPWVKGPMTETILPTKLFEYMLAEKTIIAPNFGECKKILQDNTTGFLYNKYEEIPQIIHRLASDISLRKQVGHRAAEYYKSHYISHEVESRFTAFLQQ